MKKLRKSEDTAKSYMKHCLQKWIDKRDIIIEALLIKVAEHDESNNMYTFPDSYKEIFEKIDHVFGVG